MELDLDLENVKEDKRLDFCNYIIEQIKNLIHDLGEQSKYLKMENYIFDNNVIQWLVGDNQYISVYDLYRLAASNLKIKKVDENNYQIYLDKNINIPNSYTTLYSIISLLEYGTLSVRKIGDLTKIIDEVDKSLTAYYKKFLLEETE